MRALFGLAICGCVAGVTGVLFRPAATNRLAGLTVWTLDAARQAFKGRNTVKEADGRRIRLVPKQRTVTAGEALMNPDTLQQIGAEDGDLLYICDTRWWLGGLRSLHVRATADAAVPAGEVHLSAGDIQASRIHADRLVSVELVL
jgi:hypothetical protein